MNELPPFPNSVHAMPENAKHQIQKIEVDRLQAKETKVNEVLTTYYDDNLYTYRNGQLSTTMPKATGQQIQRTV